MITFREKKYEESDLMPKAIERLKEAGVTPNLITAEQADEASKRNSRSLVLEEFTRTERGKYRITVRDKELYNWTKKLFAEIFRMKIIEINQQTRQLTAETEHLGIALDIIEVLGGKYNKNLYIVC